jgi:glycosyltransferase involved in cell wall biosynthesis
MAMMNQPLVSVVMVTRNVERFLGEAIESILDQTFQKFEFIIVDFGSTDGSRDIAASYAAKDHRIIVSEIPQCGLAAARNAGCSLAKGDYIAIQDADDVSLPNRLMTEVEFSREHPEIGLVGSAIQRIDQNGKYLETVNNFPREDREIRQELRKWNPFWQPTVLILREAFVKVGGYREALVQSEDYDLWVRVSEYYKCANLEQVLVKYRIHPGQLSARKRKEQILCSLAVQASVSLRQKMKIDPLDRAIQLTPTLLAEMGVSERAQRAGLAEGFLYWLREGYAKNEYDTVFEAGREIFQLRKGADMADFVSEARLIIAKTYWKQRRVVPGCFSFGRAMLGNPNVVKRALSSLWRLRGSV